MLQKHGLLASLLLLAASGPGQSKDASRAAPSSAAADTAIAEGVQALRNNDPAAAIPAFTRVTELRPQFAEGFLNLGLALEQHGDYAPAIVSLTRALALKPTLHGANLFLGIAAYQSGQYPKAEQALLRETHLSPKEPKALMWLGLAQLAQGHNEAAAATLDAAILLAPKDADILYHRGRAHLLVSKDSYAQMFALDPDSYRVHEVLGQADAEADRTADAIGEYELAIQRAPTKTGLHEALADLFWIAGKTDLADKTYLQELTIDSSSVPVTYKLGSLRVITGNPQEALPLLERTVSLDPSFENAFYYLGRAQVELGQDDAAVGNLQRAAAAPGDQELNTLALYQLSRLYRRMHRTAEADAALDNFRRLRDQLDANQKARRAAKIAAHPNLPVPEQIPTNSAPGPA